MANTSCFKYTKAALIMSGIWLPKICENNIYYKVLFYTYSAIYNTVISYTLFHLEIMHFISVLGDPNMMIEVYSSAALTFVTICKFLAIFLNQKKIKMLFEKLDGPSFTRQDPSKQCIIDEAVRFVLKMSVVYGGTILAVHIFWCISALFQSTDKLPLGYPNLDSATTWFKIMYIYQIITEFPAALQLAAPDLLAGGLMVLVTAELEVLCAELSELGIEEDNVNNGQLDDNEYEKAIYCVKLHNEIIDFVEDLNIVFSLPLLVQFLASSTIICTAAFNIIVSSNVVRVLTWVLYVLWILLQLLVYCYFGDAMTSKAEQVAEAAYCCNWWRLSLRTRRSLLMVVARAQRPLALTANKMFIINLPTFTTVLRASYSYFALLNNAHSN